MLAANTDHTGTRYASVYALLVDNTVAKEFYKLKLLHLPVASTFQIQLQLQACHHQQSQAVQVLSSTLH
jgi:hypothetical protein